MQLPSKQILMHLLWKYVKAGNISDSRECIYKLFHNYGDLNYIFKQLKLITVRDISSREIDAVIRIHQYFCEYNNIEDLYAIVDILCHCEKREEKIFLSQIKRRNSLDDFKQYFNEIFNNNNRINEYKLNEYRQILYSYALGLSRKRGTIWNIINFYIINNIPQYLKKKILISLELKKQVKNWGILNALENLLYAFYYPECLILNSNDLIPMRNLEEDLIIKEETAENNDPIPIIKEEMEDETVTAVAIQEKEDENITITVKEKMPVPTTVIITKPTSAEGKITVKIKERNPEIKSNPINNFFLLSSILLHPKLQKCI